MEEVDILIYPKVDNSLLSMLSGPNLTAENFKFLEFLQILYFMEKEKMTVLFPYKVNLN